MDEGTTPKGGWRQEQAREFGRRLQWARKRAGYATRKAVIDSIPDKWAIAARTYYSHERGERTPERDDTLQRYCIMFNVSRDFLLFGTGPEKEEFINAEATESASEINHVPNQVYEKSSLLEAVRYIPIIRASDIQKIISGKEALAEMTKEFLPVSSSLLAGPHSFAFEITAEDNSMVGDSGYSFPPFSHVVVDPDRDIMPGKFLLVQFPGMEPTVRQLKSSRPYHPGNPAFPFILQAANPNFGPITINGNDDCTVLGRVVFTIGEV
jgi:SOS-response transcriptional repressor LexA